MLSKNLGKYEIIKWLGGGTFGDVYLAKDTLIDKLFALKIPRIRKEEWEILKKEAKILSDLLHPNIVRFYSVDIVNNTLFMTMEYVEGESLRNLIKSVPLNENDIVNIFKKILLALDYAHKKGVLHRDLKPENILLTKNMEPKISDFGLAVIFQEKVSHQLVGTPLYLAPEGWRGNYTEKTDLFAIGCILYECFAGFPPFQGRNLEEIREKIKRGTHPRLKENVSENLKRIIEKAINPDPEKRFKNAREMLSALEGNLKTLYVPFLEVKLGEKEKDVLSELTDEQKDAVTCEDRFVLVKGGAGTGKTKTLIARAAYLIEVKKVLPDEIIITTFTGKGINEIRERLLILLSKKEYLSLNVGTLHNVALQVLYVGGKRIGINAEEAKILSRGESYQIVKNIFPDLSQIELNEIMKTISISKSNMLRAEDLLRDGYSWTRRCGIVYKRYSETLKENNLLDYDDIIFYANELLREYDDLKERFSNKIKHILVDEFQDLTYAEVLLLKLLREKGGYLFATGDEDQAIYGFRGASNEFIRKFADYFEKPRIFHLTKSFRIPEQIYEAGMKVLSHIRNRENIFFIPSEKKAEECLYTMQKMKKMKQFLLRDRLNSYYPKE